MALYQEMKKFILVAAEYSKYHADSSDVHKHLQILAATSNVDLFDPTTPEATHFFVGLHELMNSLEPQSMLIWSAITVLQKACTNKKAKEVLIHTYKFVPVLAKFLSTNHINEKQLRLLQVLSELTYGVKITWQEAHLHHLILTLVQIVMGNNTEQRAQALEVLVNLCFRNLPALYVLMRKVEINKFIKCITKINDQTTSRLQVCKMLFILEEIKGQLPDEEVLKFVDIVFNCVSESFRTREAATLQKTTDFFKELCNNSLMCHIIARYPKTKEDIKRLLDIVENIGSDQDPQLAEIMATMLEFLTSAFRMNMAKTAKLIPRLMTCTMPWLLPLTTSLPAINVLMMVTELLASQEVVPPDGVLPSLTEALTALVGLLPPDEECTPSTEKRRDQLTGIVVLLAEMSGASSELRHQILNSVDCDAIKRIYDDLYNENILHHSPIQNKLSIQLLYLVSTLSTFKEEWMDLYIELLSKREVLSSMATAILNGDKTIKYQVLRLIGSAGWGKEPVLSLCDIMTQLRPETIDQTEAQPKAVTTNLVDFMPLYVSESRINELLDSLKDISVNEPSASALMELYEYKLATMGHSERKVQAALEAADTRCIGLNHQVAQMKSQVGCLHQVLFNTQQTLEGVTAEKKALLDQLDKVVSQNDQEKSAHSRQIREVNARVADLERLLRERSEELELKERELNQEIAKVFQMESALQEKTKVCDDLKVKLKQSFEKCDELEKAKTSTEEALHKVNKDIMVYEAQVLEYKAENEEMRTTLTQCMEKNSQKDEQLADYLKQIKYLEQIREAVINVAARKDKF